VIDESHVAIARRDLLERRALKGSQGEARLDATFALVANRDAGTPAGDVEPIGHQVMHQATASERQCPW
jgi:hypothetical protein